MTLPFLFVYLNTVRGLSFQVAGITASIIALIGLAGNPLGGAWADKRGPRSALAFGFLTAALGAVAIACSREAWQAFAAAAIIGLGVSIAWPAQNSLLATLVPEGGRSSVFGLRYATMNGGLAIGALTASILVDTARPSSFVLLYLLDAAAFILAIPFLLFISTASPKSARPEHRQNFEPKLQEPKEGTLEKSHTKGYMSLAKDRPFVHLWVIIVILVTAGYSQFLSSFPAYVLAQGITPSVISLAIFANTLTVVLAQLFVLRLMRGRRRTHALALALAAWATTWTLAILSSDQPATVAALLVVSSAIVFALGETLVASTAAALVNDMAPDHLRGRYNGAEALAYSIGFAIGPFIAGTLMTRGHYDGLFIGCSALLILMIIPTLRLSRAITRTSNTVD